MLTCLCAYADGKPKARCNHCKQTFTTDGTMHLHRHFQRCSARPAKGQTKLQFTKADGTQASLSTWKFSQERSREDMAKMIILDEQPFISVERSGFCRFVGGLNPQFKIVSRTTVQSDCMKIYEGLKADILLEISKAPGRISFTSDIWTSNQSIG